MVHVGTSGFVVSPCNLQVFRQHSALYRAPSRVYQCTSGVRTSNIAPSSSPWELSSWPTWLWLPQWLCKSECGDYPASHFSVEIQWMTRPAAPQALLNLIAGCTSGCPTQHCTSGCRKDILTEIKFVSAQTARISHTSKHHSLHMMTKRLMVTLDLILPALCCTSSTRVLERVSSSFLFARSLHVLQHSAIYLSIFT